MNDEWKVCLEKLNKIEVEVMQLTALVAVVARAVPDAGNERARVEVIKRCVCAHYAKQVRELEMRTRGPEGTAWARHVAMSLCREFTKLSSTEIAAEFGKRDHGCVLHAVRHVRNRIETEPFISEQYARVVATVSSALNGKTVDSGKASA